ncbi:MAG: efflux RND transporter periplasmic adaptor subunit [Thioalkalivibrio sp.]|nr:efflux RND transporter periplasmic adaptor subunit [Thioalkalivibrio sp.]
MPCTVKTLSPLTAGLLCSLLALFPVATLAESGLAAQLDWGERYVITAPVAGRIKAVHVRTGARVEANDVLFGLDTRRASADLRAANATVERLQLELDEAERELNKAEDLYDRTLVAAREVELARIEHATVAARMTEARAQRDRIRVDIEDATIRAPASGRMARVNASPGQYVNPALVPPVLGVVGTTDPMRAIARVAGEIAGALQSGHKAEVVIGDRAFSGTIAVVGWEPEAADNQRSYRVEVTFPVPEGARLRPGQSARIELEP